MVGPNDHVIIVNGFAPDKDGPARLEWERAEMPREESSEYSDQEVGIIAPNSTLYFSSTKKLQYQGIFCPSLGAEFRPHSQSKIATLFPNTMSVFPQ